MKRFGELVLGAVVVALTPVVLVVALFSRRVKRRLFEKF